jgi:arylsulfatase A-like enzyme
MWTLLLACSGEPAVAPPTEARPPAEAQASDAPRTVVLVIGCTLRADRIGAYGNPREGVSPYLDELAAQGALFEEMRSNAPWTRPSIGSLTTGRYPLVLGIDDPGPGMNTTRGVHPDFETLGEAFSRGGYTTIGATANPNANATFGMHQGFDTYHELAPLWREESSKIPGEEVVESLLQSAAQVTGDLFLQAVLIDTHAPLSPAARVPRHFGLDVMTSPTRLDQYDAAVRIFSEAVEQLDEGLDELGRGERTLMIVGDHGEGLHTPQHAAKAHGRFLYDANIGTPWIVSSPQVPPARIQGLASNVDVKPTLLDLGGVEPLAQVDGRSRAGLLREGGTETGETFVLSETYYSRDHRRRWITPEWSLIENVHTGSKKIPVDRGPVELYAQGDRQQDVDLSDEQPEVVQRLSRDMAALRAQLLAQQQVWDSEELGDDLNAQLEALGYVEPK